MSDDEKHMKLISHSFFVSRRAGMFFFINFVAIQIKCGYVTSKVESTSCNDI